MKNNWKNIWENRFTNGNAIIGTDHEKILLELKRCNGFDIENDKIPYNAFLAQYKEIKAHLLPPPPRKIHRKFIFCL